MFKIKFYHATSKDLLKFLILTLSTTTMVLKATAEEYIVPPMINIPTTSFFMGSDTEGPRAVPRHQVTLNDFQIAKYPVTVAEFRKFVEDSGYKPNQSCNDYMDNRFFPRKTADEVNGRWDKHRFQNNEYQPVTCVTWQDAHAYSAWLSEKTGTKYRLPTEQEWEYALIANTTSRYFWGDDINKTQACLYGNFADQAAEYFTSKEYGASYVGFIDPVNCDDGEAYTSIVGLYRPNPFGLHDMVGNVGQHLDSCYYDGYQERSAKEMDLKQCEMIGQRSATWHQRPDTHTSRSRAERIDDSPWALVGFRLAADNHNEKVDSSTTKFEAALAKAQKEHLATRPKIPAAPKSLQLSRLKNSKNNYKLSWQASDDINVTGYEIYQSQSSLAHLLGSFYKKHYKKIAVVSPTDNTIRVTLPDSGGSFRVVTVTKNMTSLPSQPAVSILTEIVSIPGRLLMQHNVGLENIGLKHIKAKDDKSEVYYLYKIKGSKVQPLMTVNFKINVKKSAWYTLNYRGKSRQTGLLFQLWQDNTLLGKINYDPDTDDKTSNRHKVFLEKGTQGMQLTIKHKGFDIVSLDWLEFTEIQE